MREDPKPFEIYRHFKGMLYQIHGIAKHSETMERLVVYQQLYAPYGLFVRPLDMFMSEVDHAKYPDVQQTYRFEKIQEPADRLAGEGQPKAETLKEAQVPVEAPTPVDTQVKAEGTLSEQEIDKLTPFFDADSYEEKLEVLMNLHQGITNPMIDTMAVCLDVEIQPGELEQRFTELKNCLLKMEHFECNRLR